MEKRKLVLALALLLAAFESQAAQRMVYFNAVGRNVVDSSEGLDELAHATCTLTVINPSSTQQNFTLTPTLTPAGSTLTVTTDGTCGGTACQLTNTQKATFNWVFPDIPAKTGNTTQDIVCGGSILAVDATATAPGFLVAGGTLVTFMESQYKSTYETTKTSTNRQPVYSQTPISANAGKPF